MLNADFLWTLAGFLLTVIVLSYVFGDHALFRMVSYLFVGCTAGYVTVIVIYQVILPHLVWPLFSGSTGESILALGGLILSGLLLMRLVPGLSRAGNLALAYLVGVSAAVIISGAIYGTLLPQMNSAAAMSNNVPETSLFYRLIEGCVFLLGTISTLAFFQYGVPARSVQRQRSPLVNFLAKIGSGFIAITFGAVFAGVYAAAVTALMDRLGFLLQFMQQLISGMF